MAISAHPDDAELNAGGTLARWIAEGCEVTIVVCTNGAAGSSQADASPATVAATRQAEQKAAAREMGARRIEMLSHPDGALADTPEFRGKLVELIRRYQPHVVLTHDAHTRDRFVHRDHRITGTVVEDAIFPYARDPLHYSEHLRQGLQPHKVAELLLWDSDAPNVYVDVSEWIDAQARALQEHAGQLAGIFGENATLSDQLRLRASETARDCNCNCDFAEAFRRLEAPR